MLNKLDHFTQASVPYVSHPAHAKIGIHAFPDRLQVVTMLENPLRWRSRYDNYRKFEKHVEDSGAILWTVEVAFGHRPFEVTDPENPHHLQLRSQDEVWHKENAQNLVTARIPLDCKYIAMVDADHLFARTDWAQETLHLLQHYDVLQMFSHMIDVNQDGQPVRDSPALGMVFLRDQEMLGLLEGKPVPGTDGYAHHGSVRGPGQEATKLKRSHWGCPGGAWAYRRQALDDLGGLLDIAILGSGDWYMAKALFGEIEDALYPEWHQNYNMMCREWQHRAVRHVLDNHGVGHMPGTILHLWHGPKHQRGYEVRPRILVDTKF